MKKSLQTIPLLLRIFTVLMVICAIISLSACHDNIASQLAQGVSVRGNELAIFNLYMQSFIPYLAYAILIYLGADLYPALRILKDRESLQYEEKEELSEINETDCEEDELDILYTQASMKIGTKEDDKDRIT